MTPKQIDKMLAQITHDLSFEEFVQLVANRNEMVSASTPASHTGVDEATAAKSAGEVIQRLGQLEARFSETMTMLQLVTSRLEALCSQSPPPRLSLSRSEKKPQSLSVEMAEGSRQPLPASPSPSPLPYETRSVPRLRLHSVKAVNPGRSSPLGTATLCELLLPSFVR